MAILTFSNSDIEDSLSVPLMPLDGYWIKMT